MAFPHRLRVLAMLLCAAGSAAAQPVLRVKADATGGNDGSSWQNAFNDLQPALAAASGLGGAEIWVAAGAYRPGPAGHRAATFSLPSNVALYGGFAGHELARDERDPAVHVTTLSGDIDANDQNGGFPWYATGYAGNSLHVVTAAGVGKSTVLDGFVVSGGSGVLGQVQPQSGSGLAVLNASPTVRGCTFQYNYSAYGGAIAVTGGSPVLEVCSFRSNLGWNGRGGALSITGANATPTLRRLRFVENLNLCNSSFQPVGGAIYIDFGAPAQTIEDCRFEFNRAVSQTGFANNPGYGGAVFNPTDGTTLCRCTFIGNASHVGGAVASFRSILVESCVFDANSVTTVTASGGVTVGGVGGTIDVLGLVGQPLAEIVGCTVLRGSASDEGGGIRISGTAKAKVHSCIVRGNSDSNGQVGQSQLKGAKASSSDIQNFLVAVPGEDPIDPADFPGCIDLDPLFLDADGADGVPGNGDDDLRLQAGSPCVDAGLAAWQPPGLDAGGSPRRLDGDLDGAIVPDMGGHELSHVHLAATTSRMPAGTQVTIALTGTSGMPALILIGLEGPELFVSPYGPLLLSVAPPPAIVALGPLPLTLGGFAPHLGTTIALQAAAFSGTAGNVSNRVALGL